MSSKDEARDFLVSRRAQITPADAGVPDYGDERRVPGLRREEVAELAGVSVGYYTRLERGEIGGASESVLEAVARALRLNDVEREHLLDLARRSPGSPRQSERYEPAEVRSTLRRLVDSIGVPAIVQTPRLDLVAANGLARALFSRSSRRTSRTSRGSTTSTHGHGTSTSTGHWPDAPGQRSCAGRPAGTRWTRR
jgi:transcriptional regulator with XRE-family HTH domain